MKIGIILLLIGLIITLYFSKIKIEKRFLTEIAIIIGIILVLYGLILIVQPPKNDYIQFTKTTISK